MNIDMTNLPSHVAIIMDGNRRWAKKRMLPAVAGHKQGSETLKQVIRGLDGMGIKHLTIYAFSTENWSRAQEEVEGLMNIFRDAIKLCKKEFYKENYRINFLGKIEGLPNDIIEGIGEVIKLTKDNTGINVHIALNYGGRDEMIRAMRKMIDDGIKSADITEEIFVTYLDTRQTPDPDLIIRTSGEMRLSNFLTWQSSYSEFYFTDKYWPDFSIDDVGEAILNFQKRNRRFGGK